MMRYIQLTVDSVEDYRGRASYTYCPYGFLASQGRALLGFNGERLDPLMNTYLLGNGYRVYSPALMRFISPEKHSPFGKGGLNAFVYCLGDPINYVDPSGAIPHKWAHAINLKLGRKIFDAGRRTPFYGVLVNAGADPYALNALHRKGRYGEVFNNLQPGGVWQYVRSYPEVKVGVLLQATEKMLSLVESSPHWRDIGDQPSGLMVSDWKHFKEKIMIPDLHQEMKKGANLELRRQARTGLAMAIDGARIEKLRMVSMLKGRLNAVRENQRPDKADRLSDWFD